MFSQFIILFLIELISSKANYSKMCVPILEKKSKRMSCRRRFKIERKVREHKRKVVKEGKKSAQKNKSTGGLSKKPDVQIPNKCPFKADILREAEERKQRVS
jgi:nuclear GTP-binding protein